MSNFGNYNKTYGAIGGVIVLLLWLWIANNSLLFGAEFDAEMERGRQLQAGIEAEDDHPVAATGHHDRATSSRPAKKKTSAAGANCGNSTRIQPARREGSNTPGDNDRADRP